VGCLVFLDEADLFAPEKRESEALSAVIDMAGRGRKRGYCLIPATRRPAQLNKDVSAECNNKLIGRASLDIDRKRSAEELGFTTKEQILSLRNLEPGEFYTFGPAISREVVKAVIGDVHVKPPKPGMGVKATPPPTAKVRAILGKLADLPAEAEAEARTVAELKAELVSLKRTARVPSVPSKEVVERTVQEALRAQELRFKKREDDIIRSQGKLAMLVSKFTENAKELLDVPTVSIQSPQFTIMPANAERVLQKTEAPLQTRTPIDGESLSGPEQRVLNALAWCESIGNQKPPNELVAFLSGYSHFRSTGYTNPRGYLKSKGLIDYSSGSVYLTQEGRPLAFSPESPLTEEALHQAVLDKLDGPERKLLTPLLKIYPEGISNADLCATAGYMHERSTGYTNPRGRLKSFGLIEYDSGKVKAKSLLFL